jgi:hypothetical protein
MLHCGQDGELHSKRATKMVKVIEEVAVVEV